ncbi:MAG: YggS family pyridoxal phosphate-dependent enzyme [Acidobacteria bacterium]|nr:YggS family pyridoxal phosphate-dependent enzyme [Acidobacteriota bacterium]
MIDAPALRARLDEVRGRIARAALRVGRDPAGVRLIAVSKTFGAEHVRAAAEAGQRDFGENKVQEALDKMDRTGDLDLAWHLIGHLQSNKARKAGARFSVVHSVDDADLVRRLNEAAGAAGRTLQILVQADLAGEATKHGAPEAALDGIFAAAAAAGHLDPIGLMLIPPSVDDPERARPYFRALRAVRDQLLARGVPPGRLRELSMGMSHDFEVAVEEGATMVRVGTAIFGSRGRP